MRRIVTTLAVAAAVAATTAAPAEAAAAKPAKGDYTCVADGGTMPMATMTLFKGSKYAATGDTEKAKYVYKTGKKKLVFKSGVWKDVFYGMYDKETRTVALHQVSDDAVAGVCAQLAE